jgi:REP element-mobilizing transposase RayT
MSRNIRIQYEGAAFHVISRGNKKDVIFPEDKTKYYFIKRLKEGSVRFQVDVYAFCIMDTHYHLLVQLNQENLPDFMHFIGSAYANYLVRNGWFGHVFSGRYKSILVDKDEYLLVVSRYIHLNPVSALLVKRPEEYRWSSYHLYLRDVRNRAEGWLYREWLPEYFGPGFRESVQRYGEFVESGMEHPSDYPHDKVIANTVLGGYRFIADLKSKIGNKERESEWLHEIEIRASKPLDLESLFVQVCAYFGVSEIAECGSRGSREYRYVANLFAYMAREYTRSSCADIARFLQVESANCVSHRCSRMRSRLGVDAELRTRVFGDAEKILARAGVDPKRASGGSCGTGRG